LILIGIYYVYVSYLFLTHLNLDEGQNCRQPPVEENAATYEKIAE
jgi:hypothetical protein